jgi:hypothetical protein
MTTIRLYAQPYDFHASGFYFETLEEYDTKREAMRNEFGQPVEEFEIQFIDGDSAACHLFEAARGSQGDLTAFFDAIETWDEFDIEKATIALAENLTGETLGTIDPGQLDIDVYRVDTWRDLAEQFVDDGLFGEIPDHLANYIDYDAIARDLQHDYSETTATGERLIYRAD